MGSVPDKRAVEFRRFLNDIDAEVPTNLKVLVERWFANLTEQALRRSSHKSTSELEEAIAQYLEASNEAPRPFVWTKTADQILASVARFCARTLEQANS